MTGRYALSGVPLAQMRFSRALASRGHDVDFLIGMINSGNKAPVSQGFKTIVLGKPRVAFMLFPLIRYFKERKPDVVFTAGDHLNAIVLLAGILSGTKAKISCSSRVTPFDTYSNKLFSKGWLLKCVMRVVMRRANALTCVSKDMVEQYRQVFPSTSHCCVYNIVDDEESRDRMMEVVLEPWYFGGAGSIVVAAGALEQWKGFTDLIYAISLIPLAVRPRLLLLGDGSLKQELLGLVEELGLQEFVKLIGYVANPLKYFKNADVFVLSSYVEGLPNVLVEAMMCGCTPVSTDCPTGPREVLGDGKIGYLVPVGDASAMAVAISKAIAAPSSTKDLDEAVGPFSESNVLREHFKILGIFGEN
ncbi:glycosyltransferase [Marinobacter goseongensis]|uniref:glycosyltransferase n=1 Tax=Marinobacter goseongensis TaxID=453838 RepID=UPI0020063311|nr:glycosyltransferase [Marinobacter goseongensis]MCK7551564.1 glycosyltransferase [Marinobacter goseongensis]